MALEKKIFGYLPVSRGDWVSGTHYYQFNEVMSGGSTFMAKHEIVSSTVAPTVTYDRQTGTFIINLPDDWQLVAYGSTVNEDTYATIADLESGDIVPDHALKADDLIGNSNSRSEEPGSFIIRSTAGDLDVDSEKPARLVRIEGRLDDECHPFNPSSFHWSGFNLLNPDQKISNATISGSSIAASTGSTVYYFHIPKLTWGEYGTNEQNNGIIFNKLVGDVVSTTTPSAIAYFASVPAIGSVGSAPTVISSHNNSYYCTSDEGYIAVVIESGVDVANVCAHLAWDNEFDETFEAYDSGSSISLSWFWNDSRAHSWGLGGIINSSNVVTDEIIFDEDDTTNRKIYRRIGRKQLKTLTWSAESGDNVTIFSASIGTEMFADGLTKVPLSLGDYSISGTTIRFSSSQYSTVEDFKTNVLGDEYVYYQLASPAVVAHSISGEGTCNDMGIEEFIGVSYPTNYTVISYSISLKYFLESLPSRLDNDFDAVVNYLAKLDNEIKSLEQRIGNLGRSTAVKIDFENIPSMCGYDFIIFGTTAPTAAPNFSGQFYVDTSNKIAYQACGMAAGDWKRISNA